MSISLLFLDAVSVSVDDMMYKQQLRNLTVILIALNAPLNDLYKYAYALASEIIFNMALVAS